MSKKIRSIIVLSFLLLQVLLVFGAEATPPQDTLRQQATQPYKGLDVIWAIDDSGSMGNGVNSASVVQVDQGLSFPLRQYPVAFSEATDPNRVRWEIPQFMTDALRGIGNGFVASGYEFSGNTSIIAFNDTATEVLGWTPIQVTNADDGTTLDATVINTPSPPTSGNSSYIDLYEAILAQLANRPGNQSERLPIVIIISDSLPCAPNRQFNFDGVPSLQNCNNDAYHIPQHFKETTTISGQFPTEAQIALFLVVPPQAKSSYDIFAWNTIADTVEFSDTRGIYGLTDTIFEYVLNAAAQVIGVSRDELPIQSANNNNVVVIPPYQLAGELMVVTTEFPNGTPAYSFRVNGETIQPASSNYRTSLYQRTTFTSPPPGPLEIISSEGVGLQAYSFFQPVRGILEATAGRTILEPITVIYRVNTTVDLSTAQSYPLAFDVKVRDPNQVEYSLTMNFDADANAWLASFLPILAGRYTISADVQPSSDWVTQVRQSTFLQPIPNEQQVTIGDITFVSRINVSVPEGANPVVAPNNGQLPITRAQTISVTLTRNDNGVFPDNLHASLTFAPVESADDNCPTTPISIRSNDTNISLTSDPIGFTDIGSCMIGIRLEVDENDGKLLGATTQTLFEEPELLNVQVVDTIQLTYELRNQDDAVIHDGEISINDRQQFPKFSSDKLIEWPYETHRISVVMLDQNGNAAWPFFAPSVAQTNPEAIPFALSILNENGDNVAPDYGIELIRSDNPGLYVATIQRLPVGNYTIRVDLLDNLELSEVNEYVDAPANQVAVLVVENNILDDVLLSVAMICGAIMMVPATFTTIRRYNRKRHPLQGRLVIYEQLPNENEEPLWMYDLNSTKVNNFVIPLADLPLWRPPVIYVRTHHKKGSDAGISITVNISDNSNQDKSSSVLQQEYLGMNAPPIEFFQDMEGRLYLIALQDDMVNWNQ